MRPYYLQMETFLLLPFPFDGFYFSFYLSSFGLPVECGFKYSFLSYSRSYRCSLLGDLRMFLSFFSFSWACVCVFINKSY
ncbi:rCG43996 [Rattus norvegicus]|uniref:RCG43996 n=1 Tax=Rattus norvegicus TaxID=10116 RepID=A6J7L9_RAT|nr:rCG43996 [Rattus norvegicus]